MSAHCFSVGVDTRETLDILTLSSGQGGDGLNVGGPCQSTSSKMDHTTSSRLGSHEIMRGILQCPSSCKIRDNPTFKA